MLSSIAALLLAAAQIGSPGADVACILDRIPPTVRAEALDEAGTGVGGRVRDAFTTAARACARERSWEPGETDRFDYLAAAWTVVSEAAARLEEQGIAPGIVLEWYQAQPPGRRSSPGEEAIADLVARLAAAGVPHAVIEENGLPVGLLVGGLAAIERIGGESDD